MIYSRRPNGRISSVMERGEDYSQVLRLRLENGVKKVGECLIWQGAKGPKGYGQIRISWPESKCKLTHRLAWELAGNDLPEGLDVCHKCDTPSCINVEHLFLGTRAENMQDMARKGRSSDTRGEKSGKAVLTNGDVAIMKELYSVGRTQAYIASLYEVHPAHVSRILSGKRWPHMVTP